jgi:hypothetical protein
MRSCGTLAAGINRFDGDELIVRYDIEGFGRTRRIPALCISEISVESAKKGLNELFGISDEEALEIAGELKRLLKR